MLRPNVGSRTAGRGRKSCPPCSGSKRRLDAVKFLCVQCYHCCHRRDWRSAPPPAPRHAAVSSNSSQLSPHPTHLASASVQQLEVWAGIGAFDRKISLIAFRLFVARSFAGWRLCSHGDGRLAMRAPSAFGVRSSVGWSGWDLNDVSDDEVTAASELRACLHA